MSEYFLGQIMLTGFGFAPRYFAQCNGQLLPINQNQALFSLLGTQFGGNGQTNFQLPDLRGRTPVGAGPSIDPAWQPAPYTQAAMFGVENVSLVQAQMPSHQHTVAATTTSGTVRVPTNALYGGVSGESIYGNAGSNAVPLNPTLIQPTGSNTPHQNMQPYRVINFNIALSGVFPSRN